MRIDKVLAPLDGSTLAEPALTKAIDFADTRQRSAAGVRR
jgi:nucleotide-binding universal stress UspA family protein